MNGWNWVVGWVEKRYGYGWVEHGSGVCGLEVLVRVGRVRFW